MGEVAKRPLPWGFEDRRYPFWCEDVARWLREEPWPEEHAALEKENEFGRGGSEAGGFLDCFFDDMTWAIPGEVEQEMNDAMYEAKRAAAFEVLVDFARRLVPVIEAIEICNMGLTNKDSRGRLSP